MLRINLEYNIKDDVEFLLETEKINKLELSEKTKVSRTTLNVIEKTGKTTQEVLEKIYSYAYEAKYRMNSVKEELIQEKYSEVLFHGSKEGLSEISVTGSRDNCDFGNGFYLGKTYNQALSFVYKKDQSSVYSFRYSLENLKIKKFQCDLEWVLAICYYRGTLDDYALNSKVKKIIDDVESSDVVIAPIADNKMFYIMAQFTEGEINADVALHSLSASSLGLQYIFKTDRALQNLIPIERYYLCASERNDCQMRSNERGYEIDTKLKLAKREFKNGLYIEEILK